MLFVAVSCVPSASSFCHANAVVKSRPRDSRFIAFTCNPSYHVLPKGDHRETMSPNCGNGRSICATVDDTGQLGYGKYFDVGPKPRLIAAAESTRCLKRPKSPALLISSPKDCRREGLLALRFRRPGPRVCHHAPRLPIYPISTAKFGVISRWIVRFHWIIRGGRPPPGSKSDPEKLSVPGMG